MCIYFIWMFVTSISLTMLLTITYVNNLCIGRRPHNAINELNWKSMWSGLWFHTSMQSSKNRYIPYNLGLKIVNNKTIWYITTLFSISSHLFTGKPTMTSSCLPAKWRRRHRACILSCYHYWNQKHWPTLTNHRKAMEMKQTKLNYCQVD